MPTAAQFNGDFSALLNEFNGNIDNSNVKATAAINESKILFSTSGHGHTGGTDGKLLSFPASDGWSSDTNAWVYASASTFTIAGVDLTAQFTKGTRLKFTNSTLKYAIVASSSFSTNTTVTIVVNTDYVLANAAITAPYYSYAASPQGYPTFFNFTPAFSSSGGAFTNAPASNKAIISAIGNQATALVRFTYNGTSGGSGNTLVTGLPLTPTTVFAGWGFGSSSGFTLGTQVDATPQLVIAKYDATTCIVNSQIINAGATYQF